MDAERKIDLHVTTELYKERHQCRSE